MNIRCQKCEYQEQCLGGEREGTCEEVKEFYKQQEEKKNEAEL